jgi:uncharacterized protein DUF4154
MAVLAVVARVPARAQGGPPTEYQVKAAFLYNIGKFVEWPQPAFPDSVAPFVIGILGKDPFGAEIDRAIAGKTLQGRPVRLQRFTDVRGIVRCHILFVSSSERERLPAVFQAIAGWPVLVVGESEEFLAAGGSVAFVVEERKVRFDIDLTAAEGAGLKISSRLLKLARNVERR